MFKPNFATRASRTDNAVILSGRSDEPGDILEIRVSLLQGDHVQHANVPNVADNWNVGFDAAGFVAGPAAAFGIEIRRENAMTITWTQMVEIPEG